MGVQINGDTGNISATKADYSGNVTIGGTLTYEDVTNIDSVGLVTARSGIEVGARPGVGASISVDGNAIFSGITTAATLKATTGIVTTLTATTGIVTTLTTNTLTANSTAKVGSGVTLSPDGNAFFTGIITATTFSGVDTDKISEGNTEVETVDTGSDGYVKITTEGSERFRVNNDGRFWLTGADMGGSVSFPSSSSGARIQIGAHTFQAQDAVYHNNRLGMQINGDLSASIMLADVYNNASFPGYGYVMVQGPSTSDYVTYAMCPDGPAKGNNLNFHIGEEEDNIHSGTNTRQVWFNAGGNAYKRDNSANWSTTSDERLKKNIVDNNKGLAEINQLRITSFEYRKQEEIDMSQFPLASIPQDVVIEGDEGPHTGVIAQEIESIFPECVRTSNKGAKTVDADAITWALVNAIKELSAKNDALEAEIAALKSQLNN